MITLFLSALLLSNPSIEAILEHHLDSPEGRTLFLTEQLRPFVERADQLNREIVALSEEVTQKMAELNDMLPTVNLALRIDTDFEQIDELIHSAVLSVEQQEIADRIATICKSIDSAVRQE